ncbi:MAG: molybdopterin-dependent oxidoreductase [Bacteroidota bacterium]
MPNIVIDNKKIEAASGKTIIEVALEHGIPVTHFCWHPELSVSGNCRMCLVEVGIPKRNSDGSPSLDNLGDPVINYFPKLQIACATPISEGMHVRTNSENVVHAQEAVMEFLLINHPLDCPICDEAGQCKLQEYAYEHSSCNSRFVEEKNHGPKRVSWGPNVMFDSERCITCSRCIRFANEIAKQDVLTFVNRGDHVTIELFEGTELDSPYSMNVIDLCPVGALTSKDFRFKARVWDMSFNDSICPGCARGCNTKVGVLNNEILRIEPRTNLYVNKFWMCDYGRLETYKSVNENRVPGPMVRYKSDLVPCSREEAYSTAADLISKLAPREIMFLGSGRATNEDNYLLAKFAKEVIKSPNVDFIRYENPTFADNFLRVSNMSANDAGALEVGLYPGESGISISELGEKIRFGEIKALYMMEDDVTSLRKIFDELQRLNVMFFHGINMTKTLTEKANVAFAASTWAEVEGTYVNINNRVQHFTPVLVTSENINRMGMKMSRLDKFGAPNDRWTEGNLRDSRPNWWILNRLAQEFKAGWNYTSSKQIFNEIAEKIAPFKGMSYKLLDKYDGLTLGNAENPDAKIYKYESHILKPN